MSTRGTTHQVGMQANFVLESLPTDRLMTTVDEALVRAPLRGIFAIARSSGAWRRLRIVTFRDARETGQGARRDPMDKDRADHPRRRDPADQRP